MSNTEEWAISTDQHGSGHSCAHMGPLPLTQQGWLSLQGAVRSKDGRSESAPQAVGGPDPDGSKSVTLPYLSGTIIQE